MSFEPKLRPEIEQAREDLRGVSLKNCTVKRNRGDMEVLVSNQTKVMNSPKKFKVDENDAANDSQATEITTLEMLKDVNEHQYITVKGKVISVCSEEKIMVKNSGRVLTKRDCLFADSTAVYRCVAWEDQIKLLQENKSYELSKVTVRSFNGAKYLSVGEGCGINQIEDVGDVIDDESAESGSGGAKVVKGDIVAVVSLDLYKGCRNCNAKVANTSTVFGVCTKCNTKMKLTRCANQSVANVILEDLDGKEYRVAIFNDVLEKIVAVCEATDEADIGEKLLTAPTLAYTISHKDIVSSFTTS